MTLDLLTHPTGRHGFDLFDDDARSKEIIQRTLVFFRENLGALMPNARMNRAWLLVLMSALLSACVGVRGRGAANPYALDSVTAACRQNPALCTAMAGKEPVQAAAATIGIAVAGTLKALDAATTERIEDALKECAEEALRTVLKKYMNGNRPTPEQCREQVRVDPQGRPITRAMQFGIEMHQLALKCAKDKLNQIRPGGFSLEPRYRYDSNSKTTTLISAEQVQFLLSHGRSKDLLGTLVPDVVIHNGAPLQIQAIYDFKFACSIGDGAPPWRRYPEGHFHYPWSQGELYQRALGPVPARVAPPWGVIR